MRQYLDESQGFTTCFFVLEELLSSSNSRNTFFFFFFLSQIFNILSPFIAYILQH